MRVGLDGRWLSSPEPVAYNRYILGLVTGLLRQSDVEVILFTMASWPIHAVHLDKLQGVRVITLASTRELLWEHLVLPRALRRLQVDVFHAPANQGIPAIKVCRYVLTCHGRAIDYITHMIQQGQLSGCVQDYLGDLSPQYHGAKRLYRQLRGAFLDRVSWRRADRVIAVSETAKQELIDFRRLPQETVRAVYEAPDDCFRQPPTRHDIQSIQHKYKLPERYIVSADFLSP